MAKPLKAVKAVSGASDPKQAKYPHDDPRKPVKLTSGPLKEPVGTVQGQNVDFAGKKAAAVNDLVFYHGLTAEQASNVVRQIEQAVIVLAAKTGMPVDALFAARLQIVEACLK